MKTDNINGTVIEFDEKTHEYIVNGIIVPSVTQIIKKAFPTQYQNIPKIVLQKAAKLGTEVHEAIEAYENTGEERKVQELKLYKYLKKKNKFKVLANEIPIVIFKDEMPMCAGRLDMLIEENGKKGIADIKRTSKLNAEYLQIQLSAYAIGYEQLYGEKIEVLRALHLRSTNAETIRKYVEIEPNFNRVWELINEVQSEDN